LAEFSLEAHVHVMAIEKSPLSLNNFTLGNLPAAVRRPQYDRARTESKLVHIGAGGFNRSHLAVYLDDLLAFEDEPRWGELGIGLMPGDKQIHSALRAQDWLYGVLEIDADKASYRIVGSLTGHLLAAESIGELLQQMSTGKCAIVSLTVTEGGYFLNGATGGFESEDPAVRHDLKHRDSPRTWMGIVAAVAERRRLTGGGPFTLLSCDNLQHNGAAARKALTAFAAMRSDALAQWIEANVSFPSSMVDRITPRTTEENRTFIRERFGVEDLSPVVCEPFRQWVLEDEFIAGRPAWERVSAQMTSDVAPYEKTKMRLLNGGHSTLGYAGDLLGFCTIADAASDAQLKALLIAYMDEVRKTVPTLPGIDLDDYTATVVRRFSNPAIRDQVARICSDGCAKIDKFLAPVVADLLAAGAPVRIAPFVIASWLHSLRGTDEQGRQMTSSDPMLPSLSRFIAGGCSDARLALEARPALHEIARVHPHFLVQVQVSLERLRGGGVREALDWLLKEERSR
jgi:mannitol 2-dehydrogenase